jgi:hypothetical protein
MQRLKQNAPLVAANTARTQAETELLGYNVKKAREGEQAKQIAADMGQKAQAAGGQLDPDELVSAYEQAGLTDQADHVRTLAQQQRIQAADETTKHLTNMKTAINMATGLFSNVQDQGHYEAALQQLPKIVPPDLAKYITDQLGPTFDPQRLESVRDMGRTEAERLAAQTAAINNGKVAIENETNKAKLDTELTISGGQLLSTARDSAQYKQLLGIVAGGSKTVAAKFDPEFSPQAMDRAKQLATGTVKETDKPAAVREYEYYRDEELKAGRKPLDFNGYQAMDANRKKPVTTITTGSMAELPNDPTANDILSQTGLNINTFRLLTGNTTGLARNSAAFAAASQEATKWAREHHVDISTLPAQYKAQNAVLERNIERLNNTKIMESELNGTIENLQKVIGDDPGGLRAAVALKAWLGQEVNDPNAQQYKFHLGQLQNELAAYYAAAAGRPGSGITIQDNKDADETIKNGISKGGLIGLQKGVTDSTAKMGPIMQSSVDRAQKSVWNLFGVGGNFKPSGATAPGGSTPKEGEERQIPGQPPGTMAVYRGGKWIAK